MQPSHRLTRKQQVDHVIHVFRALAVHRDRVVLPCSISTFIHTSQIIRARLLPLECTWRVSPVFSRSVDGELVISTLILASRFVSSPGNEALILQDPNFNSTVSLNRLPKEVDTKQHWSLEDEF